MARALSQLSSWLSATKRYAELDWTEIKSRVCSNDTQQVQERRSVVISLVITDLYGISEKEMEMGVQIRLREVWREPALISDEVQLAEPRRLPSAVVNCIWTPDTIFSNMKRGGLYDVTGINRDLKIVPGGYFYRFSRYYLTLSCPMTFHSYPMDTQRCQLRIRLMAITDREVDLRWYDKEDGPPFFKDIWQGVHMNAELGTSQFEVLSAKPTTGLIVYATGNFTTLEANFVLRRHLTASLVNSYLPSLLLVCVSWVSFWLDTEAVPGRVTLAVTAILTLATQIVYSRSALPSLDYLTALDVWLFSCLIGVVLSLVEFTVANCHARRAKQMASLGNSSKICKIRSLTNRWTSKCSQDSSLHSTEVEDKDKVQDRKDNHSSRSNRACSTEDVLWELIQVLSELKGLLVAKPVQEEAQDSPYDRYSRILFPCITGIFSVIYWIYYSSVS